MIRATRASLATKIVLSAVCLAFAAPVSVAAAAVTKTTVHFTPESIQVYEQQLAGGKVQAAQFNTKVRSLHLTLTDGRHVIVHYAPHQETSLATALRARGIVALTAKGKPVKTTTTRHHKLRYIAGGILVVVLIVIVGAVLVVRRRRADADY